MTEQRDQAAEDEWQTRHYDAGYQYSVTLRQLHDTNPWPHLPVLEQAISTLATELWDRCFTVSEIRAAFEKAVADLPSYAAGQEIRP